MSDKAGKNIREVPSSNDPKPIGEMGTNPNPTTPKPTTPPPPIPQKK